MNYKKKIPPTAPYYGSKSYICQKCGFIEYEKDNYCAECGTKQIRLLTHNNFLGCLGRYIYKKSSSLGAKKEKFNLIREEFKENWVAIVVSIITTVLVRLLLDLSLMIPK